MIALLTGTLAHRDHTNRCIVDVNGVGYDVLAPLRTVQAWGEAEADRITVYVSTQVREDAITLYGFDEAITKQAFEVLMSVSGVGPKMALAALDALSVAELAQAVERDDVIALSSISGVGKKTAQRLALELKGKLPVTFEVTSGKAAAAKKGPSDPLPLALAQLQYGKSEIDKALAGLKAEGIGADRPTPERLKAALRILSQS